MTGSKRSVRGEGDRVAAICTALRRAIIERALQPGDRLPEDALGERFGVSRTIARHALGQLAAEGLVDLRRNRIAVVATPSFEDARDIFDIRLDLEKQVVRRLAGKLTDAQAKQLKAIVEAEHEARHGPKGASIRLATDFHVLLAEMTGKPILIRYVTEICYRAGLSLAAFGRPHSSDCAVSEHLDLIEVIRTGPAEKAEAMMVEHLEAVASRALLQSSGAKPRDLMDILAPYAD
ncbi:GntR family transcriptional regulator [bacterium M00.F.Ca.ET.194.01.1.1]|uniref:GntR family transcriptional regulator n=1 Tax=Agrobacterium pusense TaxID=648995 RepID=UPI00109334B8|nr:GntR family transcriptional regulator [Agrobacterium pusense]TGR68344.1 GntR family transcriptional regulator [bacterium M00.F.Ca.ET.194.01.1.1]TGS54446.1 GntR family transcriptional regulator [bacterium M00.F.Ca.ET.179.01.1.1]TGV47261.1 GntR family transcriptional regulator [bacterium M00.F.Ca.ET.168.01.1.1]